MDIELFRDGHRIILNAADPKVERLKAKGFKTRDEVGTKEDLPPAPPVVEAPPAPEPEKALDQMTAEELRAKAQALNLPITDKMGKARLLEILKNSEA